jgi:hypothetical protein
MDEVNIFVTVTDYPLVLKDPVWLSELISTFTDNLENVISLGNVRTIYPFYSILC